MTAWNFAQRTHTGVHRGGMKGYRVRWEPRLRRARPAACATRRHGGSAPDSRSPTFVDPTFVDGLSERIVPSLAEINFLGRKLERAVRKRGTNF